MDALMSFITKLNILNGDTIKIVAQNYTNGPSFILDAKC